MTHKRIIAAALALLLTAAPVLLTGCQEQPQVQQPGDKSLQTITIPALTVDLQAPENRVEVPQDIPSRVYDAAGNPLTGKQWLLNSKFAKEYIKTLGIGEHTFRYESDTQTGTITLTVTDSQAPDYIFTGQVPQTVTFLESLTLPELVKDQDSYQDSCAVSYALTRGEETVAMEGFVTPALADGSYTWTASITKEGKTHNFTQSFTVQTFEEYLTSMENELLLDVQKDAYIHMSGGAYPVDTMANTLDYFYSVNPKVLDTAMTAQKTTVTFVVTLEQPVGGDNGSLWYSNNWHGYAVGITESTPFVLDRSDKSQPVRYISAMEVVDGKYVYRATALLDPTVFNEAQPFTLQFNYAKCIGTVAVEFE